MTLDEHITEKLDDLKNKELEAYKILIKDIFNFSCNHQITFIDDAHKYLNRILVERFEGRYLSICQHLYQVPNVAVKDESWKEYVSKRYREWQLNQYSPSWFGQQRNRLLRMLREPSVKGLISKTFDCVLIEIVNKAKESR